MGNYFHIVTEIKKNIYSKLNQKLGKPVNFDKSTDPHIAAGVLKCWLCELQAPLLTWELHDSFIAAQGYYFIIKVININ